MEVEELDYLLKRFDQTEPHLQRQLVGTLVERMYLAINACHMLISAAQYAASSFAQVPSSETVPPIVLHNCKDKLNAAVAKARRVVGERTGMSDDFTEVDEMRCPVTCSRCGKWIELSESKWIRTSLDKEEGVCEECFEEYSDE